MTRKISPGWPGSLLQHGREPPGQPQSISLPLSFTASLVHGKLTQLLGMSASWCRCAKPLLVGSSATYLSSCKNELNSAVSLTAMAPLSTSMAFPGDMSEN